jgi:hypothetical protein
MANLVSVHLETVLVSLQDRCIVCTKCRNRFGHTRQFSKVMWAQVEARFDPFGDSTNIDEDRYTVCAERTIGFEIVLDAPDGMPR